MTYGGALSFMRRKYSRNSTGVDVVVCGIPFDNAVTYRPGCRLGPRAIRAASVQLAELKAFPFGFDPFDHLAVTDWGDCFLDPHLPHNVTATIERHAEAILATGAKMLVLGGDHYISLPLLRAHAKLHGPLTLIHFDAHSDTWPDDGERLDHGTMLARAVAEKLIDPATSIQLGLRTVGEANHGFLSLTAPEIHRQGITATLAEIRSRTRTKDALPVPVYITFDIDVLDPACAPGTGTPVAGGLMTWQALELVRGLAGLNLVGLDLVEVSPPFDHAEITALAAATIGHDWLCLLADYKRNQNKLGKIPQR